MASKSKSPRFVDCYCYAVTANGCPLCNEHLLLSRLPVPDVLVTLLSRRAQVSKALNQQHMWPKHAWGAPPVPTSWGWKTRCPEKEPSEEESYQRQFQSDSLYYDLFAETAADFWPILEEIPHGGRTSWVNHPQNIIMTCRSDNSPVDEVLKNSIRSLAPESDLPPVARSIIRGRISKYRDLKRAIDRVFRLCSLAELRVADYTKLKDLKKTCVSQTESARCEGVWLGPSGLPYPPIRSAEWRGLSADLRGMSGFHNPEQETRVVYAATVGVLRAIKSVAHNSPAECSKDITMKRRGRRLSKKGPRIIPESLHWVVWIRHLIKAERTLTLDSRLAGDVVEDVVGGHPHDLYPRIRVFIQEIVDELTRLFLIENCIDLFLIWNYHVTGHWPTGWHRSSIDDLSHLIGLSQRLRRAAEFYGNLDWDLRTPLRLRRIKSMELARILITPWEVARNALGFMLRGEIRTLRVRWGSGPEESSWDSLIYHAFRLNLDARVSLGRFLLGQTGSVLSRAAGARLGARSK